MSEWVRCVGGRAGVDLNVRIYAVSGSFCVGGCSRKAARAASRLLKAAWRAESRGQTRRLAARRGTQR